MNYLRGDRSNEAQNSGAFRDRFQVLGDIVHSSPVYHNGMLYAGGNDGMLHAFDAAGGDERFAYVPNLVFGNLSALVDPDYSHKYFVDLSPTIQDVTLGVARTRPSWSAGWAKAARATMPWMLPIRRISPMKTSWPPGSCGSFPTLKAKAQRLAWPMTASWSRLRWVILSIPRAMTAKGTIVAIPLADMAEGTGILDLTFAAGKGGFQDGEDLYVGAGMVKVAEVDGRLYDSYMGYSYSRPVIVKSNDPAVEWLVIFGNGYNSSKSHAVLYILNLATGELIKRIDTGVGNCNGLSSPIAIDIDSNGTADYVYAGDLQGNLWKFDFYDTDAANWEAAYEDTGW